MSTYSLFNNITKESYTIQESQNKGIRKCLKVFNEKGKENGLGRQKDSRKIGRWDKKSESQRATEKEEITSTEFPEGGNTIYTKRTPRHPNGGCLFLLIIIQPTFYSIILELRHFPTIYGTHRKKKICMVTQLCQMYDWNIIIFINFSKTVRVSGSWGWFLEMTYFILFYKSWRKSLKVGSSSVMSKSITKLSLILVFIDF